MVKLAVVFQSGKGHTKVLADSISKGINSIEGASANLFEIRGEDIHNGRYANETLMSALDSCDGIVLGCATYMGSASAIFKSFLESAFQPRWFEQRWKDKVAAGFTNSASQNGDKLTTLLQLSIFAMQMGMIWVGVSDLPGNNWSGGARSDLNRLGTWLGAMGQSNADEDRPSTGDIDTAERLGARIAIITRRIKDGVAFETERLSEPEFRKNNIARRDALSGGKG
ncbi:flavodoxin family protein [Occallatibacter riparius]|uniref:Flavodoxin family protein n=1 Tax=Occallatibacter riparius TaxID=1002689 RepID=A0A9J7BN17_9BACT|nr:flavodoxin family protein [Occallatibacter riparius]UWZ82573.1 flavodoxin family protein [Occallatibacter riparius]